MNIKTFYPDGKKKALTMSYDDGQIFDRRLVEIFNKYNIKGTFHLNSGTLGKPGFITPEEVNELFKGHEISCHTVTHPYLIHLSQDRLVHEIWEDRRNLERLAGYIVRGMSYPFGVYHKESIDAMQALGIVYSRTVNSTRGFDLPGDLMQWHPTCHHGDDLMNRLNTFKTRPTWGNLPLMYVWGHSFEFDRENNWELIENFCSEAAGDPEVWYATNIEIADYISSARKLIYNTDLTQVYNPTAIPVWLGVENDIIEIKAGETVNL